MPGVETEGRFVRPRLSPRWLRPRRIRLHRPHLHRPHLHHVSPRWIVAGVTATLTPGLVAAAVALPRAAAHPGSNEPAAKPPAAMQMPLPALEPTPPPPPPLLDDKQIAAAAKRAPASAQITRLPQVDLNGLAVSGIPHAALAAYVTAAHLVDGADTSCHIKWWLLAGIGLVESGHGRSGGSASPRWSGIAKPPILGPVLDGSGGFGRIPDSDHGRLDGNKQWDRAVGPMQFLPSTWSRWGTDARGRAMNPQDIRAAALAAARYLCASGADLSAPAGMASAVYSYNHSWDYVRLVLSVAARYAGMDPNALGVDRLPKDQPKKDKKKDKKKADAKKRPSPKPSASASADPAASPAPSASGSSGSSGSSSGSSSSPSSSPSPSSGSGSGSGSPSIPPILPGIGH